MHSGDEFVGRGGASFLVHDGDWQTPAITEQWAFNRARELLPARSGFAYLAFPWATLIDRLQTGENAEELLSALRRLTTPAGSYKRVVTVCQHILFDRYLHLFAGCGVTDVFWSHHHTKRKSAHSKYKVNVYPFPLYPANSPGLAAYRVGKTYDFSFVGATSNRHYIDIAREIIGQELDGLPNSLVRMREKWHYQEVVYDHQIFRRKSEVQDPLTNPEAFEYRDALAKSHFVLCPSGSGANSLRLWEAIDCGAIPIILSPTYIPPGNARLWQQASLSFSVSRSEIARIPQIVSTLLDDTDRMKGFVSATKQLRLLYGRDVFVHDILMMFMGALSEHPQESGRWSGALWSRIQSWVGLARARPA